MSLAPLRAALRQALAAETGDAAHDLAHADRVWMHARTIAHGEGMAPSRVLLCAAYLHDLVTLPKDHPKRARAATMSASAAGPVMQALGLAPTEVAQARHAIEAHSFSGGIEPQSPEARILRDADRLEALGAIGVARCFAVSGALGRPLFDADDPFALAREPDDAVSALDHFAVKLLKLPETFLTPTGRRLAEERAAVMRRYLADLARELGAPPPAW
ncbi:HD domain-containing protein [Defluviimonas sp. SAOS-178_SWC]|uniref:HD domain-containing protein n=1 Tax=Defluviimonas sp. SAOS-178_SWC TaxID=3121287 RepID=UPI0032218F90